MLQCGCKVAAAIRSVISLRELSAQNCGTSPYKNDAELGSAMVTPGPCDQRQLLLPVDADYSCRSWGETIWYRRYRIGHRSAGSATEAEASLDYTSRARSPCVGQIVVLRNVNGFYAATRVLTIKDDTRGDDHDELRFEYAIQDDGSDNFIAVCTQE